jgi:hypothetical protein
VLVRRIDSERPPIGVVTTWRLRLSFLQSYFWLLSSFGTGRRSGNLVSCCKDLDAMLPVRLEVLADTLALKYTSCLLLLLLLLLIELSLVLLFESLGFLWRAQSP